MSKKEILYPVYKENRYAERAYTDEKGKETIEYEVGDVVVVKGTLIAYPTSTRDVEWVSNKVFKETLNYIGFSRGRSSATFVFKDGTGAEYPMFMKDMDELLSTKNIDEGRVSGFWTFCKRGQNYGIRLATEKEIKKALG